MPLVATRITRVDLTAARTVLDGTFRVHSIHVANKSANKIDVEFTDADDVAKFTMAVLADTSDSWDVKVLWDNGMKVGAIDANVIVTVAHSQDGV